MSPPERMEIIGTEFAILWKDGSEDYLPHSYLRTHSPSASNIGERDIFGNKYGGENGGGDFTSVKLTGWQPIGNYAVRLEFSDGHNSGLYSWDLLHTLANKLEK